MWVLAVSGIVGLGLAYVLVRRSPPAAIALVLLPPAAWFLRRPEGGLILGIACLLVLPSWHSVGAAQISVLRIASTLAIVSFFASGGFRPRSTDYVLLILVAVIVLGWILQYDQPHVGRVVSTELTPIGFYLGGRAIPRDRIPAAMLAVLIAGTVGALTVFFEFLRGHAVFVDPTAYVWSASDSTIFRPGGIFGSPPGAATVLCVVLVIGLGCLVRAGRRTRPLVVLCLSICAATLVLTFTRGGIIAAGVGIVVFLWLLRSPLLRPLNVAWFIAIVLGTIIVLLPRVQGNQTLQEGVLRSGTFADRENYWSAALPVVTSNAHDLIFGAGTGVAEASAVSSDVMVPSTIATTPTLIERSLHNEYATTMVEQGAVGVCALIAFLVAGTLPAARGARSSRSATSAALAASMISLAVVMTVNTALLHGPSFGVLMLCAGLATSTATATGRPGHATPTAGGARR